MLLVQLKPGQNEQKEGEKPGTAPAAGRIMLDSQVQARGFIDLEVGATKDFFLFFNLLSEHICLRIIDRHETQPACHQFLLTRQSHNKCMVFLAIPDTYCP